MVINGIDNNAAHYGRQGKQFVTNKTEYVPAGYRTRNFLIALANTLLSIDRDLVLRRLQDFFFSKSPLVVLFISSR